MSSESPIILRLKKLRNHYGLSQTDFAKRLNIKQTHLSAFENGYSKVNLPFMQILIDELNVNINWLISGKGPMFNETNLGNISLKEIISKLQEYEKMIEGE